MKNIPIPDAWALLVGRVLLSLIFIMAGWAKIGGFEGTVGYVQSVGLPFAELIVGLTILIELVGGLMILFGLKTKFAALILALFTLLAAFLFHGDFGDDMQMMLFMRNLAIAGGFFVLMASGAGRFSVDARKASAPETR